MIGLLIAFLAIYVTTAGTSFWRIIRFSLHFFSSSEDHADGVYHHQQAILRNSNTALDAASSLIFANRAWRHRAKRVYRRLLPVIILALLVAGGFAIASTLDFIWSYNLWKTDQGIGIFSSRDARRRFLCQRSSSFRQELWYRESNLNRGRYRQCIRCCWSWAC